MGDLRREGRVFPNGIQDIVPMATPRWKVRITRLSGVSQSVTESVSESTAAASHTHTAQTTVTVTGGLCDSDQIWS